jgi:hypothetical protein
MSDKEEEVPQRRMANIWIQPKAGVDAEALFKKITTTVVSQPEYKIQWDESVKYENGRIYAAFTINEEADIYDEVMDQIEMMYDEVEGQDIIFQVVME